MVNDHAHDDGIERRVSEWQILGGRDVKAGFWYLAARDLDHPW